MNGVQPYQEKRARLLIS